MSGPNAINQRKTVIALEDSCWPDRKPIERRELSITFCTHLAAHRGSLLCFCQQTTSLPPKYFSWHYELI